MKGFTRYTAGKPFDAEFSTVLFNFNNCQPEVVSDVISGMADQDFGMDVRASFGDSRLKMSKASFSAHFQTLITSGWKYIMTSYPVWLSTRRM